MEEMKEEIREEPVGFEEIEHAADAALRIRGRDFEQLLENAAKGMAFIVRIPDSFGENLEKRTVEVHAEDREGLLVEWLGELVFLAETESLLFEACEFEEVGPTNIKASVLASKAIRTRAYVKAVTYHDLKIVETQAGLEATVVFDL